MICQVQRWKSLERWVPGGNADWECVHPLVSLDALLTPRIEHVRVNQTLGEWTPITIHFDGSIVPRERNTPFKGTMFAAYPGDLIFSKIDARNGAISLIPESLQKVVVTSEYPIHTVNTSLIDGCYMAMLLRTPNFLKLIRNSGSGTSGRKRITPENFRAIEIPLPDLEEQRYLIAAYQQGLDRAAELDAQAQRIERDAQREFEAALGLTPPPNLPKRPFQIAHFRDIERWSHEGILQRSPMPSEDSAEGFSTATLGEAVNDIENGWSVQCASRPARDGEWAILKISAVSTGTFDPNQNKALLPKYRPRPALEVHPGDLIISRCNITRLVGVSAMIRTTPPRLMLCDKLFRVIFKQDSPIHPEFLNAVLRVSSVRQQIEMKVTGTSPTMKNISKQSLLELVLPLPAPQIQELLAEEWQKRLRQAASLRNQAAELRTTAWNDFITAVFT